MYDVYASNDSGVMMLANVEAAVRSVCAEIHRNDVRGCWRRASESDLLFELVACILGSRVPFELALAAAEAIRERDFLQVCQWTNSPAIAESRLVEALREPMHRPNWPPCGRRYRFATSRARYISRTIQVLYSDGGSLSQRLHGCRTDTEARRLVMKLGAGVGPKQGSLFLRNIGFSDDLAILDSHVLRYMLMSGFVDPGAHAVSTLRAYEDAENKLRGYANELGYPLGCLDQAIWIVMRVMLEGSA